MNDIPMINTEPHENAHAAGVNINNSDKEDGSNKNRLSLTDDDDDDNHCNGEDGDDPADNVVKNNRKVGATIDSAAVGTSTTNTTWIEAAQKKREKAKYLLTQVGFARTCTLNMVVFSPNNKDILFIAGIPLHQWNSHMLPVFCCAHKINIRNKEKIKRKLYFLYYQLQ